MCLNFADCTYVRSLCSRACKSSCSCSSRVFLGVWVLLAGCQSLGSGAWPGSQPVRNFTRFPPSPTPAAPFQSKILVQFSPLPCFNHLHRAHPVPKEAAQRWQPCGLQEQVLPCLQVQLSGWIRAKPQSLPPARVCSAPPASRADTATKSLFLHNLIGFHPGLPKNHFCGICKLSSS